MCKRLRGRMREAGPWPFGEERSAARLVPGPRRLSRASEYLFAAQPVVVPVQSVRIRTGDLINDARLRVVGPVTSAAVAVVISPTVIHEARAVPRRAGSATASAASTTRR